MYAQLYATDKDTASRHRFETLLEWRKTKRDDNTIAIDVRLHRIAMLPLALTASHANAPLKNSIIVAQDDDAPPDDQWSRRTTTVLDIVGDAMHTTPLSRQFKSAVDLSANIPELELRIHDVRHATPCRVAARRLQISRIPVLR